MVSQFENLQLAQQQILEAEARKMSLKKDEFTKYVGENLETWRSGKLKQRATVLLTNAAMTVRPQTDEEWQRFGEKNCTHVAEKAALQDVRGLVTAVETIPDEEKRISARSALVEIILAARDGLPRF